MVDAVSSSETTVNIYQTTWWNIQKIHHMSQQEPKISQYSTLRDYITNDKPCSQSTQKEITDESIIHSYVLLF
jgi:hypothetical protein